MKIEHTPYDELEEWTVYQIDESDEHCVTVNRDCDGVMYALFNGRTERLYRAALRLTTKLGKFHFIPETCPDKAVCFIESIRTLDTFHPTQSHWLTPDEVES